MVIKMSIDSVLFFLSFEKKTFSRLPLQGVLLTFSILFKFFV